MKLAVVAEPFSFYGGIKLNLIFTMFADEEESESEDYFPPIPYIDYSSVHLVSSNEVKSSDGVVSPETRDKECPPEQLSSLGEQKRLQQLEADVKMLKETLEHHYFTPPLQRDDQVTVGSDGKEAPYTIIDDKSNSRAALHAFGGALSSNPLAQKERELSEMRDEEQVRREGQAEMELRKLVPHLSPVFQCTYQDCVLLTAAIRHGGCVTSTSGGQSSRSWGNGGVETVSLRDQLRVLESEKRMLHQRFSKQSAESEGLRREILDLKERLDATKKEAKLSSAHLGQKRDEMRRQVLLEETRCEKLQMQNKKLEMEIEQLKNRLRSR